MKLDGIAYWKLKAGLLEILIAEQQLNARRAALLQEHGINGINLKMDDATLEVEVINANSQEVPRPGSDK